MALTRRYKWDVSGLDELDSRSWYLVSAITSPGWSILVLQHLLNRRIPLLEFFIKQQLMSVPVMGLAWWHWTSRSCGDTPQQYLQQHPGGLRGREFGNHAQGLREIRAEFRPA